MQESRFDRIGRSGSLWTVESDGCNVGLGVGSTDVPQKLQEWCRPFHFLREVVTSPFLVLVRGPSSEVLPRRDPNHSAAPANETWS
jgi:hypothetical protein